MCGNKWQHNHEPNSGEGNKPFDFFLPSPSLSMTSAPHRTRRSSTGPPLSRRVPSGTRTGLGIEGCAFVCVCVAEGTVGPDSRCSGGGRSIVGGCLNRDGEKESKRAAKRR